MSVYKRGGVYWAGFVYRGVRYQESTGQITPDAARAVERKLKDAARQRAHGVAIDEVAETPFFQEWAEIYFLDTQKRGLNEERVANLIKGVLRFFGRRPKKSADVYPGAPYHDLRLGDLIDEPGWIVKWEAWLDEPKRDPTDKKGHRTRRWSGQTKNQHRSALSQFYKLARKAQWRKVTRVTENPCVDIDRDRRVTRKAVLTVEDVSAILAGASYHLRVAMAIALLAPKFREGDILRLEFRDLSPDGRWLTVHGHKTEAATGKPLVAAVPEQLRTILLDAKRRAGKGGRVITYQGQPIAELRGAVRGAVERASATRPHLRYGRTTDRGITFHTLRHTASTLMAELHIPLVLHRDTMGHQRIETTLDYTHLRPTAEVGPAEQLSAALPIQALVMDQRTRARTTKAPSEVTTKVTTGERMSRRAKRRK